MVGRETELLRLRDAYEQATRSRSCPLFTVLGSAGVGSAPHLYWELFRNLAGVEMLHVPYRAEGPALNAPVAGQTHMALPLYPPGAPFLRPCSLRPPPSHAPQPPALPPYLPALAQDGPPRLAPRRLKWPWRPASRPPTPGRRRPPPRATRPRSAAWPGGSSRPPACSPS